MLDMLKEGGAYSLTRVLAVVGYAAFLLGSGYLIATGNTWGNYETFASLTGGGGAAMQVANKLINSRWNSEQGQPFIKKNS